MIGLHFASLLKVKMQPLREGVVVCGEAEGTTVCTENGAREPVNCKACAAPNNSCHRVDAVECSPA